MSTSSRGQSEVLGTALMLGLTVLSIGVVLAVAGAALDSTRDTADIESAEQAMSQLDSKIALVALGQTPSQTIPLGRARAGTYTVDPNAGWLRITHVNATGPGTDNIELYQGTLGAILYEQGDVTIAYQGGGVWRKSASCSSVVVSPPEFHYRGETLTIPVIQVRPEGSQSASGDVTVQLQKAYSGRPIYPDVSKGYRNPIENGSIVITVHSEFYQGWGAYFDERTAGEVTVNPEAQTAQVSLITPGVEGAFKMPLDGDSLTIRGLRDRHALEDLNITLAPDDADSAGFSNLKWSMYVEEGSRKLELHIRGGGKCKSGQGRIQGYAQGTVYYTNGGGTYYGWVQPEAFPLVCEDLDGDGELEGRIVANWTGTTAFKYTSLSKSDLIYFNPTGSLNETATFGEHPADVNSGSPSYTQGQFNDVNTTVNHYMAFFGPTLELTVADKGSGRGASGSVSEDASAGTIYYGGTEDFYVTYIHATENRVNVTLT